jgi:orotidine-5'-phosphate decarboxylase
VTVSTRPRLIVALDVAKLAEARALIAALEGLDVIFKVGYEPLYNYGDEIRQQLERSGADYFIDGKLHDIPRTVAAAVRAITRPGVRILTIHALGGIAMMQAAVDASIERAAELGIEPPKLFAVTLLTSLGLEDLGELGLSGGPGENVIRLAALARDARCAGVVCSPNEVRDLKGFFGVDFEALCGGIRPSGTTHDDQKRTATPRATVEAGADYLVVGRPITEAADPAAATRAILAEMDAAAGVAG